MRRLAEIVNQAGITALQNIVQKLVEFVEGTQFEICQNYLPLRPLVCGGDDVTFVCDGRLGVELAALYIKKFEKQPVADGKPLTVCAGISIVKVHYPFSGGRREFF